MTTDAASSGTAPPRRRKRRWLRRALVGGVVLIAGAVSVPFVFPTAVVRYVVGSTDLARYDVMFERASLTPGGTLTLHKVTLPDTGPSAGLPLVLADKVTITFDWSGLLDSRVKTVDIEGLVVHARSDADAPLTLTRLVRPEEGAATEGGNGGGGGAPFWFDTLNVSGSVEWGAMPEITMPPRTLALQVGASMRGARETPVREVTLALIAPARQMPMVSARLTAGPEEVVVHGLELRDVRVGLTAEAVEKHLGGLPEPLRQVMSGEVAEASVKGTLRTGGTPRFAGSVAAGGLTVSTAEGASFPLEVRRATVHADVDVPLTAEGWRRGGIREGQLSVDGLTYGPLRLAADASPATRATGEATTGPARPLLAVRLHTFDGGRGLALEKVRLSDAMLAVEHAGLAALSPGLAGVLKAGARVRVADASFEGTVREGDEATQLAGQVLLEGVHASGKLDGDNPLELANGTFFALVETPLSGAAVREAVLRAASVEFDHLTYGDNAILKAASGVRLSDGVLTFREIEAGFAEGKAKGAVAVDLAKGRLAFVDMTLGHIDQHVLAQNLAPDTLDATGHLSGTVKLTPNARGELVPDIRLTTDEPGTLKIGDPQVAESIADLLPATDLAEVPPNLKDIVVGQLKNYAYQSGRIRISSEGGRPVIFLDYTRQPLKAGDPGHGITMVRQVDVAGKRIPVEYKVNVPVNLSGVSISVNKSVEELLAMAAGFETLLVDRE